MELLTLYLVIYGVVALGHLGLQMLLGHLEHARQSRRSYGLSTPSVTVVVPAYNENPVLLHRCLLSIDRQDYPRVDVVVVDDGSHNVADVIPVHDEFSTGRFRVVLRPENTGKRNCQAVVFDQTSSDVIVTIDSDTILEPHAIRMIVRRFEDERVGAVTGNVEVINKRQNLLTRLIAYRYWTAFNQERAAQSLFGVVMCASGPFSAYRRTIIDEVKESYVTQRFLGRPCTFGDDRHLTNLVLGLGYRVVYDEAAHARTQVPTRMRAYLRQQTRWNRSFYREILWTARFAHKRNAYMALDLTLQTIMPFALLVALGVTAYVAVSDPVGLWRYGAVVAGIGLVRAIYGMVRTRSAGFMLFVLYGFVHVFLLIPVRLHALATIRRGHWGSRVEDEDDVGEQLRLRAVRARSAEGLAEAETRWSADIRRAVAQGDSFALYWQPIRRLWNGQIAHAETLLRLRHEGQILSPGGFLSIAEQHGLMPAVDTWVTGEALSILSRHAITGQVMRLEVNVSTDSMRDPNFTAQLERRLASLDVAPRNLALAISERAALADLQAAERFGRRVRALGCMFVIDNWGGETEGSLTMGEELLKRLPLDYVKLDRSLIRPLPDSAESQERLAEILAIIRAHGVETIAPFVGDENTVEILKAHDVDYVQGFHIGTPTPVERPLDEIVALAGAQAGLATA